MGREEKFSFYSHLQDDKLWAANSKRRAPVVRGDHTSRLSCDFSLVPENQLKAKSSCEPSQVIN